MNPETRHFICNNIFNCWQIRVFAYEQGVLTDFVTDKVQENPALFPSLSEYSELASKAGASRFPFFAKVTAKIYYAACPFEDRFYMLGPMSDNPLTRQEERNYLKEHHASEHLRIPMIPQLTAPHILSIICYMLTGRQFSVEELTGQPSRTSSRSDQDMEQYRYANYYQSRDRLNYQTEIAWLQDIESGNYQAVEMNLTPDDMDMLSRTGVMAHTTSKQLEYMTVSSIVLASRAAMQGGADPEEMYNLSDLYLQKASVAARNIEYLSLSQAAAADFSAQVRKAKQLRLESGSLVEQCKEYIAHNRGQDISTQDIADDLHVNRSYLSNLFHKKTGQTIREYISEQRLISAQNLLKYSDTSVAEISDYLQFSSQSHFTRFFREKTGVTPTRYRAQYQTGDFAQKKGDR